MRRLLRFRRIPHHPQALRGSGLQVKLKVGGEAKVGEDYNFTSGTVEGENDLVEMELYLSSIDSSMVTLSIAAGAEKVKVWLNANKSGGPVLGGLVRIAARNADESFCQSCP